MSATSLRGRIVRRLALALAACVLSLALGELVLRTFLPQLNPLTRGGYLDPDPVLGWVLHPGWRASEPYEIAINSLGMRDGITNILHAGEHCGDSDEISVEGIGHQARERGLADTRWPPEDHRMRPPRLERDPQRLARTEQMRLADHLVDVARAHTLGQRRTRRLTRGRSLAGEEIVAHGRHGNDSPG